jgi:hypothetical protein
VFETSVILKYNTAKNDLQVKISELNSLVEHGHELGTNSEVDVQELSEYQDFASNSGTADELIRKADVIVKSNSFITSDATSQIETFTTQVANLTNRIRGIIETLSGRLDYEQIQNSLDGLRDEVSAANRMYNDAKIVLGTTYTEDLMNAIQKGNEMLLLDLEKSPKSVSTLSEEVEKVVENLKQAEEDMKTLYKKRTGKSLVTDDQSKNGDDSSSSGDSKNDSKSDDNKSNENKQNSSGGTTR